MLFRQIFDPDLAQYSYLLACQQSKRALLVDPQRDVDRYLALAEEEGVEIVAVAETHIHADFLSGTRELSARLGAAIHLPGPPPTWTVDRPWESATRNTAPSSLPTSAGCSAGCRPAPVRA